MPLFHGHLMAATNRDTEPDDDTEPDWAGPAIGRRSSSRARAEIKPFTLYSYDSQGRETPHPMQARPDELDAATVVAFTKRNATGAESIDALHNALRKVLCDDDGIPAGETVRPVVWRGDGDDAGWVDTATLDERVRASEVRYLVGDQTDWASIEEAIEHGRNKGSSRRRYEHLMDPACRDIVEQAALEEILDYLISGGGERPTSASRSSRRSQKTKTARSGRS